MVAQYFKYVTDGSFSHSYATEGSWTKFDIAIVPQITDPDATITVSLNGTPIYLTPMVASISSVEPTAMSVMQFTGVGAKLLLTFTISGGAGLYNAFIHAN